MIYLEYISDQIAILRLAAQRGLRELKRGNLNEKTFEDIFNKVVRQTDRIVYILSRR